MYMYIFHSLTQRRCNIPVESGVFEWEKREAKKRKNDRNKERESGK